MPHSPAAREMKGVEEGQGGDPHPKEQGGGLKQVGTNAETKITIYCHSPSVSFGTY